MAHCHRVKALKSAPFARLAGTSENVLGGTVDAAEISIGGMLVVDSSGSWVGPANPVNWGDLQNIPVDIANGDDDSLAALTCTIGEVLSWNGSQWGCASDNALSEAEVEAYVTNGPLDLASGTTMAGAELLTSGGNGTLSGLSCLDGEIPKWDNLLMQWSCGIDVDTDSNLTETDVETYVVNDALDLHVSTTIGGQPIMTENTQLSESQVEDYITNGGLDLAVGTTMGGVGLMTSTQCSVGEILSYDGSSWVCASFQALLDADNDGVMAWNDCDDSDSTLLSQTSDADCDGVLTANDCDDSDSLSTIVANDGDCDGITTNDDCDDADPFSSAIADDGDCDGIYTLDDCDDADPSSTSVFIDGDCDGVMTNDDCNDSDSGSTILANDGDCDGTLTAEDCDDADPSSTVSAQDGDCDGVLTVDDCDDADPMSTVLALDGDCDGVLTADDCDDSDPSRSVCHTFVMTGADQTWTVPSGVTSITAYVWGAAGGGSNAENYQISRWCWRIHRG